MEQYILAILYPVVLTGQPECVSSGTDDLFRLPRDLDSNICSSN